MRRLSMLLVPGLVSMALAAGPMLTTAYAAGSDDGRRGIYPMFGKTLLEFKTGRLFSIE